MLAANPYLTPDQVREAYGVDDIQFGSGASQVTGDGAGQTIAIIDGGDDPALVNSTAANFNSSDLGRFDTLYGLPAPPSFTVVGETGGARPTYTGENAINLGQNNPVDTGETVMDVEWAHAMAPGANIVLIELQGGLAPADIGTAIAVGVPAVGATVVSMSFGGPESIDETDTTTPDTDPIISATEVGNTVTITTADPTDFGVANEATITGVSVAGYNGSFPITSVNGAGTSFTYTDPTSGLASAANGTASVPFDDDNIFDEAGVTYLASSGDNGTPSTAPSVSPNVVAVGATNLNLNTDSSYAVEKGWSNAGLITRASEVGGTVTITTANDNGFTAGNLVSISGEGAGYDGEFTITSATSSTTFTYTDPATNQPVTTPAIITSAVQDPLTGEVTITTATPLNLLPGDLVTVAGVGVSGYDGVAPIDTVLSPTSFQYSDFNGLLANSSGGTVSGSAFGNEFEGPTGNNDGGSTGGVSEFETQPAFQQGTVTKVTQSTQFRTTPDVSFVGGTATPVDTYDSFGGGLSPGGGTSLSAPCWAGLIAIADQGLATASLPSLGSNATLTSLYDLPTFDFHDITSGYNGYNAGPGYDLVSGIGTPVANQLLLDLDDTIGAVSGPLNYQAPESYTASGAPIANNMEVTLSGSTIDVYNNGVLVDARSLAETSAINIYGADNVPNTLTVDFTGGNMIPSGGLNYSGIAHDGGTEGSGESIAIQGQLPSGPWASEVVTSTGPQSGSILFNGTSLITYVDATLSSAPIAVNDSASLYEDTSTVINVLANDTTPFGNLVPATVTIVSEPGHGTVVVDPTTGAVTYTPSVGYSGGDSFQYTVENNLGVASNAATVSITVILIHAPIASNAMLHTAISTPLTIDLLSLVTAPDNNLDPTSFQIVNGASNGTSALGSMGVVTYTPNSGFIGGDSFTYRVASTIGVFSNVATVTIIIGPIGSFSGFAYVDVNNNGIKDSNEVGIDGVTMTLVKTDGSFTFTETTTTASDGSYTFNILPAGVYTITQTQPAFFQQGKNTSGTIAPAGPSNNEQFANITLGAGINASGYDFGELGLKAAFVQAYLTRKAFFASADEDPTSLDLGSGSVWLSFDAGINGTLSADAAANGSGTVQLQLYNSNMQLLVTSAVSSVSSLLNYAGSVGQPYFLKVSGASTSASLTTSISATDPWHNGTIAQDVNGDGTLEPLDALMEIALLNSVGFGAIAGKPVPTGEFPDVLGTGILTPLDALNVISAVNASSSSGSSGSTGSGSTGSGSLGSYGGTVLTLAAHTSSSGSAQATSTSNATVSSDLAAAVSTGAGTSVSGSTTVSTTLASIASGPPLPTQTSASSSTTTTLTAATVDAAISAGPNGASGGASSSVATGAGGRRLDPVTISALFADDSLFDS